MCYPPTTLSPAPLLQARRTGSASQLCFMVHSSPPRCCPSLSSWQPTPVRPSLSCLRMLTKHSACNRKLMLLGMPVPSKPLLLRSAGLPTHLCMQDPATAPQSSLPSTLHTCWCPCAWRCTWLSLRSPLAAAAAASPSGTERAQASAGASVLRRRERIRQQQPALCVKCFENLHCWLVAWCQTNLMWDEA